MENWVSGIILLIWFAIFLLTMMRLPPLRSPEDIFRSLERDDEKYVDEIRAKLEPLLKEVWVEDEIKARIRDKLSKLPPTRMLSYDEWIALDRRRALK